jgi:nucleoside-diphosphate-sugar epimerase
VDVTIAGAHGQIALRLARLLAARGDRVTGLIRNPEHAAEVSEAGASPVVCDLERASIEEIAAAVTGADAVVFAAGGGPGSGAARKLTMDRDGAVKLLRAATTAGITRYLMISATGAENPPGGGGVFDVYLQAKAAADAAPVPRDDVASVLAELLADRRSSGRILYLSSGPQLVGQALDEVFST